MPKSEGQRPKPKVQFGSELWKKRTGNLEVLFFATAIDKVAMECGGKRSATPLWLRVALLLHPRITAVRESGVALRLPPHSTSVAPVRLGDFVNRPVFIAATKMWRWCFYL